jgi:hypothetical protein
MSNAMQQRRATAAGWTAANPTLKAGELGLETDTGFVKCGDGATTWANLRYYALGAPAVTFTPSATWTATISMLPSTRQLVLGANLTISTLPTPPSGLSSTLTLVIKQAASGGPYTVTWPASGIVWAEGASAPSLSTTPNAELIVHLFWTGQGWRGMVAGNFFA